MSVYVFWLIDRNCLFGAISLPLGGLAVGSHYHNHVSVWLCPCSDSVPLWFHTVMDAHLRWDCDSLVLCRLGRWSQLLTHKHTPTHTHKQFYKYALISSNLISPMCKHLTDKKNLFMQLRHAAYKCTCPSRDLRCALLTVSAGSSVARLFDSLLLSIWLRHLSYHLSRHLRLHFPACHHSSQSATRTRFFLFFYKSRPATYNISFHWQ